MKITPLGDQAALAYLGDELEALRFADAVRRGNAAWLVDVVPAYASVAVFFNLLQTNFQEVRTQLELLNVDPPASSAPARLVRIPCCYAFQLDLDRVAQWTSLSTDEVIELHTATEYRVYAIGFCPGFPYLGYLPPSLSGVPRHDSPRVRVEVGSVGLTGRQTGIYTEPRPGGWNLVGRTPLELVHVADGYFPLRTGDRVQFFPIDEREFARLRGERL